MASNSYDENKLKLQMQLQTLMLQGSDKFLKQHFKICSIDGYQLCIYISMIKSDCIYFKTYLCSDNIESRKRSHKVFGKHWQAVVDEFFSNMTKSEIIRAENILLRQRPAPKVPKKPEKLQTSDKPRFRRTTKAQKEEKAQQNTIADETIKSEQIVRQKPKTEKDRNQAKLERKLFSDPKMWKWDID